MLVLVTFSTMAKTNGNGYNLYYSTLGITEQNQKGPSKVVFPGPFFIFSLGDLPDPLAAFSDIRG
jgi:hypothetical protein